MFRFTIRDVLWLMVVVGLAVRWNMDHWSLRNKVMKGNLDNALLALDRYELRKALESEGYTIREDGNQWIAEPPHKTSDEK